MSVKKGVEQPQLTQATRVWVTFGKTIQVANYEPAKVDIGMASDVRSDETVEEALERVTSVVQRRVGEEIRALAKFKKHNKE